MIKHFSRTGFFFIPYPTRPYPTLPYPTLPYPTLQDPTLPYPTLPYTTLPYPTRPYPTLLSIHRVQDTRLRHGISQMDPYSG